MHQTKLTLLKNFRDCFKILLIPGEIFGLVTFSYSTHLTPSRAKLVANIFRIVIFALTTIYALHLCATNDEILVVVKSTTLLSFTYSIFCVTTIWILSVTNRHKFITFVTKIIQFDANCCDKRLTTYQKGRKKVMLCWTIKYLFLVFFSVAINANSCDEFSLIYTFLCSFMSAFSFTICRQSAELALLLKFRFFVLNEKLLTIITVVDDLDYVKSVLTKVCTWHHHLSRLVKLYNDLFGIILLLVFGFSFLVVTVCSFVIAAEMQHGGTEWYVILGFCTIVVYYAVDVVSVCDSCYATIEEVRFLVTLCYVVVVAFQNWGSNSQNSE